MAVALVGYTQGAFSATGLHAVTWPSGTAAGHLAVILCAPGKDKKPTTKLPAGWVQKGVKSDGTSVWAKMLTAADLTAALAVTARVQLLQVFSGAAAVGKVGSSESMKLTTDGGALLLLGWKATTSDLTVGKIHSTDVENGSYLSDGNPRKYNAWWVTLPTASTAYIDTNASQFFAVEMLAAGVAAPAPTPIAPASGASLDFGQPVTIQARHTGLGAASTVRLRIRKAGDATWNLVGLQAGTDAFVLNSGTTSIPGSWFESPAVPAYVLPASFSYLSNSTVFEWGMSTNGGDFCAAQSFSLHTKPTVTSVTVGGSGLSRTVSWAAAITNGTQVARRVRVALSSASSPDVPIHDSGWIMDAATSLAIPATAGYGNGASYRAWVEVQQTGGQVTAPTASGAFTVSWTPPAAPTFVTVQSGPPMTLTASGIAGRDVLRVERWSDGWVPFCEAPVTAASMTVPVPLQPWGDGRWRVSVSDEVSGVQMWSTPTEVLTTGTDAGMYLVALDGLSHLQVHPFALSEPADTAGVLTSYGIGASRATVARTESQGLQGEERLIVETQADKDALFDWLTEHPTFWLRYPPERSRATYADVPPRKVARVSALSESRVVQKGVQIRTVPLAWVEQ